MLSRKHAALLELVYQTTQNTTREKKYEGYEKYSNDSHPVLGNVRRKIFEVEENTRSREGAKEATYSTE